MDKVVIFLDIDGTIYNSPNMNIKKNKLQELFPLSINNGLSDQDIEWDWTEQQAMIAYSHLFDINIVDNLHNLISKIESMGYKVLIVLSSNWRKNKDIKFIKSIFSNHIFSNYIIDKTCDSLDLSENLCLSCKENFNPFCRAAEIIYWLHTRNLMHYIIFDNEDDDKHLSSSFGDHFIHVDSNILLSHKNIDISNFPFL